MSNNILLEALKEIRDNTFNYSDKARAATMRGIATEAIKKWEDSSAGKTNFYNLPSEELLSLWLYEHLQSWGLYVNNCFGEHDYPDTKQSAKELAKEIIKTFTQWEDSSGKETGRLDEFFKWIDNSEFPFIDGYWIAYFNEKDNQLTTHQLYQLYKSKQLYESVPPYKEEENSFNGLSGECGRNITQPYKEEVDKDDLGVYENYKRFTDQSKEEAGNH